MSKAWSRTARRGVALLALAAIAGCNELPPNFWSEKAGEIVNRSIFAVINAVLGGFTGGAIQI